jgi:hypothetical protein
VGFGGGEAASEYRFLVRRDFAAPHQKTKILAFEL